MCHRLWMIAGPILSLLGSAGCYTSGLSPRETGMHNYSTYVYALYDGESQSEAVPELALPAGVAVAQVGEVAPPGELLAVLRGAPDLFSRAFGIPGIPGQPAIEIRFSSDSGPVDDPAQRQVLRMRQLARDLRARYLLLVGGTLDESTNRTPWSLLDLTIIGAFVVPSQRIQATARASASLIDVEKGRILLTSSTEVRRTRMASNVAAENDRDALVERLRRDVLGQLGRRVVEDCHAKPRSSVDSGRDISGPAATPRSGLLPVGNSDAPR